MKSIGLMSGTSVDGLDVCCAEFALRRGYWSYRTECAKCYPYPEELRETLRSGVQRMSALEFAEFHSWYGDYLGSRVNEFMEEFGVRPDIIASHGSTVFHEPSRKVMFQVGDGAAIAARTSIPTVSDFRRLDIMLGGQGAPLVPIGDDLLFGEYDACLNIGGFSNISYKRGGRRIAFDISPVNYVINRLAGERSLPMDRDGIIASCGDVDDELFGKLEALGYYHRPAPKSLGREWVEENVFPLLEASGLSLEDRLRTYYEHCAARFADAVLPGSRVLVTGGGAWNKFLLGCMERLSGCALIVPDKVTVEFKEALIFAFLGVLYMMDIPSCLSSVTGASRDNIGGMLFKV